MSLSKRSYEENEFSLERDISEMKKLIIAIALKVEAIVPKDSVIPNKGKVVFKEKRD